MKRINLYIAIFCNTIFLLYSLHYFLPLHNFILSISIGLLIFIVPGMGWIGILKEKIKDSIMLLFFIVCFSLGILVAGLVGHYIFRLEPKSLTFLIYLCVITNIGIFLSEGSKTLEFFIGRKKEFLLLILYSFLIYGCVYYGAKKLPSLVDIDAEVPAGTYGLLFELKPYQTSDICPVYFAFCHPPFTTLYSAFGILFLDKADEFRFYYDSAKQAEKTLTNKPREKDTATAEINQGLSKEEEISYLAQNDRKLFFLKQKRILFAGRMANLFFCVLIFFSLFKLTLYLTKSQFLGLFAGSLYVFSPGIFIRSCSVYHLSVANYASLILAYQYLIFGNEKIFSNRLSLLMFLPGVFAAWTNQKILILVAAIAILNIIHWVYEKKEKSKFSSAIINIPIIGYILGMILFWIYGFLIDQKSFILYHLRVHLLDRIFHLHNMCGSGYPSVRLLWKEFQIEFPVFILVIPAIIFLWKKYIKERKGIFILWPLVGAVSFSLVDWKQTRHLMFFAPALILLLMMSVSVQKKWYKVASIFFLVVALLYCLWFDARLLHDFTFYRPTADW